MPLLDRMIVQTEARLGKAEARLDKAEAKAWQNDRDRGRKRGGSGEDSNPAAAKRSRPGRVRRDPCRPCGGR